MFELSVADWLESPYLRRVAQRVAWSYQISASSVPDLYQELCLALWKAGPERVVNATRIFHTANFRAIELLRRNRLLGSLSATGTEGLAACLPQDLERALLVRARVNRLPAPLRRFYQLRYEEGLTQRELVAREHLTRGQVRGLERMCLRWICNRGRWKSASLSLSSNQKTHETRS